jgi:hypothetical protein
MGNGLLARLLNDRSKGRRAGGMGSSFNLWTASNWTRQLTSRRRTFAVRTPLQLDRFHRPTK